MLSRFDELLAQLRVEVVSLLKEQALCTKEQDGPFRSQTSASAASGSQVEEPWDDRRYVSKEAACTSECEETAAARMRSVTSMPVVRVSTLAQAGSFGAKGMQYTGSLIESQHDHEICRVSGERSSRGVSLSSLWRSSRQKCMVCLRGPLPLLNPNESSFLKRWDTAVAMTLVWVALVIPVQLCFSMDPYDGDASDPVFILTLMVDLVFACDLILQFFVMTPRSTTLGLSFETRHHKIVRRYLLTWCPLDLLSIIPFDVFGRWAGASGSNGEVRVIKIVRLLRLWKLARMVRAVRLLRRVQERMSVTYGTMALIKSFILLLLVVHWLACVWCGTLLLVDPHSGVPRWIDVIDERDTHVEVKTKDSRIKTFLNALYFTTYTITTVGYGDISPLNIIETVVCNVMLIVAGISWAVILGEVCGIVSGMHPEEHAFRQTMDQLSYLVHDRILTPELQRRLRSFFLSKKVAQRRERQVALLNAMSPGLQGEVVMQTHQVWIKKVPIFRSLAQGRGFNGSFYFSFLVEVAMGMRVAAYAESETFGSRHVMYILTQGYARTKRIKVMTLAVSNVMMFSGSAWGTDFMLADRHLQQPPDAHAETYVECMTLQRDNFLQIIEGYKESCPTLPQDLRRYTCWLALQRAIFKEARRRKDAPSFDI